MASRVPGLGAVRALRHLWAYLKLRGPRRARTRRIDWLGNITFAVGLIAVMIGITYGIQPYGGHTMGWTSPACSPRSSAAWPLLVAFAVIETQGAPTRCSASRCSASAPSPPGNLASLLAGHGPRRSQFMLIIWLQGIWLPEHGYSFEPHAAVGRHLHAAADRRLPDRRTALRLLSDRFGARPFATGGHARGGARVRAARAAAGQLLLLGLRGAAAVERARHGPFAAPNRAGDHEQPAARAARRRTRG